MLTPVPSAPLSSVAYTIFMIVNGLDLGVCSLFRYWVDGIKEPKKVEMALWKIIPPQEGSDFCHRLVFHGRDVPQQAFLQPPRDAKIASVATLALLAICALLSK